MGREYNVGKAPQGIGCSRWFHFEGIERGPGNPPGLKSRYQRFFFYDRTARRIDQQCSLLHYRNCIRIDHSLCLRSERTVKTDDIGLLEQSIEPIDALRAVRNA